MNNRTTKPLAISVVESGRRTHCTRPVRMLRLAQVLDITGFGKTKIYALQAEGKFPMRVKIGSRAIAWIEEEVQAWLAARIEESRGA
jgi:prophage regulatory protein